MRDLRRRRRAAALLVALLAPPLAAPAQAEALRDGPLVRVLLVESASEITIDDLATGTSQRALPSAAGPRIDGRAVGDPWRREGASILRVEGRRVRGAVLVSERAGRLDVVNELPLESYVAGTVGAETPLSFGPEVLRAQAVAARTYALYERERRPEAAFHLRSTSASQRYLGVDAESAAALAATRDTAGQVLLYHGAPILAVYHATSGGQTAEADEVWTEGRPYLQTVAIEGEDVSPDTYWRSRVSRDELAAACAKAGQPVGRVKRVEVDAHADSGRVREVRVTGSSGHAEIPGPAFRELLGETRVRSTLFDVRADREGDGFVVVGSGRGHGVGMSQWGAYALARQGTGWRDILARFYPGATLEHWRSSAP